MGRYMQAVEPNKRASQYVGVAGDKSLESACSEMNVEDADNVKYVRAKMVIAGRTTQKNSASTSL